MTIWKGKMAYGLQHLNIFVTGGLPILSLDCFLGVLSMSNLRMCVYLCLFVDLVWLLLSVSLGIHFLRTRPVRWIYGRKSRSWAKIKVCVSWKWQKGRRRGKEWNNAQVGVQGFRQQDVQLKQKESNGDALKMRDCARRSFMKDIMLGLWAAASSTSDCSGLFSLTHYTWEDCWSSPWCWIESYMNFGCKGCLHQVAVTSLILSFQDLKEGK